MLRYSSLIGLFFYWMFLLLSEKFINRNDDHGSLSLIKKKTTMVPFVIGRFWVGGLGQNWLWFASVGRDYLTRQPEKPYSNSLWCKTDTYLRGQSFQALTHLGRARFISWGLRRPFGGMSTGTRRISVLAWHVWPGQLRTGLVPHLHVC